MLQQLTKGPHSKRNNNDTALGTNMYVWSYKKE